VSNKVIEVIAALDDHNPALIICLPSAAFVSFTASMLTDLLLLDV
jgi:hypothetical protein